MKFRIIRDYDEFVPQICINESEFYQDWRDIGKYTYYTIEEARKVCSDYKLMHDNQIVEEFEL